MTKQTQVEAPLYRSLHSFVETLVTKTFDIGPQPARLGGTSDRSLSAWAGLAKHRLAKQTHSPEKHAQPPAIKPLTSIRNETFCPHIAVPSQTFDRSPSAWAGPRTFDMSAATPLTKQSQTKAPLYRSLRLLVETFLPKTFDLGPQPVRLGGTGEAPLRQTNPFARKSLTTDCQRHTYINPRCHVSTASVTKPPITPPVFWLLTSDSLPVSCYH